MPETCLRLYLDLVLCINEFDKEKKVFLQFLIILLIIIYRNDYKNVV